MITVISGTNRPNSNTLKIAKNYLQLLEKQGVNAQLFSLEDLPHDLAFSDLFNNRSTRFQQVIDQYILPVNTFVILSPEYNGSFPGILKTFFDAMPPALNRNKKAALVGISDGRAGNLRGMDHLTGILNYLQFHVHPNKLPISRVQLLMDEQGKITDPDTLQVLTKHVNDLINWH